MARDPDSFECKIFTGRQNCDKAMQTLDGILEGITMDGVVNAEEQAELRRWINQHENERYQHPLIHDAITVVERALSDGVVTTDEVAEIRELCASRRSVTEYYDDATQTLQRLHGILHGLIADRELNDAEVRTLEDWLNENYGVREFWPVSEIETVIVKAMQDRSISAEERVEIMQVVEGFTQFSAPGADASRLRSVRGICATAPDIVFPTSVFCITGRSDRGGRRAMVEHIERRGGLWRNGVSEQTKYLVVCAEGNSCWAYATYGRKVEEAMRLREKGHPLVIVHERDFWDAVAT